MENAVKQKRSIWRVLLKYLARFIILFCIVLSVLLIALKFLFAKPVMADEELKVEQVFENNLAKPAYLRHVVDKLAVDFAPRAHNNLENLNKTADFIKAEFTKVSKRVYEQKYTAYDNDYRNIMAEFGATEGEAVVIGAHYDTCQAHKCELGHIHETPGADDNASGIAGLLSLAKMLEKADLPFPVVLAAYTLEEPPYFRSASMGSAKHVEMLVTKKRAIKLMICLEMIGYYTDKPQTQDYPSPLLYALYPSTGNFVAVVDKLNSPWAQRMKIKMNQVMDLECYSINAPAALPGIDFSDHLNFWAAGIPAVMVTDTAMFRNKEYHLNGDTPDRLDYGKMAEVVNGVFHFVKSSEELRAKKVLE